METQTNGPRTLEEVRILREAFEVFDEDGGCLIEDYLSPGGFP